MINPRVSDVVLPLSFTTFRSVPLIDHAFDKQWSSKIANLRIDLHIFLIIVRNLFVCSTNSHRVELPITTFVKTIPISEVIFLNYASIVPSLIFRFIGSSFLVSHRVVCSNKNTIAKNWKKKFHSAKCPSGANQDNLIDLESAGCRLS